MKIFIATLETETNTFSPIPTGRAAFMGETFSRTGASRKPRTAGNIPLVVWREAAEADGHAIVESICAVAEPAGPTLRGVYEELRGMILSDLQAAMPVDLVLLNMHGAMVADGYDDCEGDTLAHVRALVGPSVPIGVELDLHCHLTEAMRANADIIIAYKEYPHTDIGDRAAELYTLGVRAALGEIRPVIAYRECRMISVWRTPNEPMRGFVARMKAAEGHDGILSVSFGHGFPWADVAEVGAKMVVVADGDPARAQALADQLGGEIWAQREADAPHHDTIDAAIDAALAAPTGPVVLADVADNAGGGAPSDNTAILRRLVERGVRDAAVGCFWDPQAVAFCLEAGEGASFDLRIGGKCGTASDAPIDLRVTVRALAPAHVQTGLSGGVGEFGPSAWVSAEGIDIVLVSLRGQVFHPDAFTGLGCTLADKRIVVVKSSQHFHAGFAPIASAIRYVSAGGALLPEFAELKLTKRTTPYWPRVADPFATNERGQPAAAVLD